jgi:hypothetical protein
MNLMNLNSTNKYNLYFLQKFLKNFTIDRKIKNIPKENCDTESWSFQKHKNGKLQHQQNHRSFEHNSELVKFSKQENCLVLWIDRIEHLKYQKFVKNNNDLCQLIDINCDCETYRQKEQCDICSNKRGVCSRSFGVKYQNDFIPNWNMTFSAGSLCSQKRIFYGINTIKLKTRLVDGCLAFITFTMTLPINDKIIPESDHWEELAIGFTETNLHKINIFIRSRLSKKIYKTLETVNVVKSIKDFNHSELNEYKVDWKPNKVTVYVNKKQIYSTPEHHPKPQLPGLMYFIIRPDLFTDSVSLLKNIKRNCRPKLFIESFSYKPIKEIYYFKVWYIFAILISIIHRYVNKYSFINTGNI